MKVKELKDIIAYLEDGGRKTLEGSVEKFIKDSKSFGFDDEYIFNTQQSNGMTPHEEWQERYSSYTNLLNYVRERHASEYKHAYQNSYHPIHGWRKKEINV